LSKKILITGSEGQLGKELQSVLIHKFNVLSTSRNPSKINIKLQKIRKMDITDRDNVLEVINKFKPNIIINCAAYSDVDGNERNHELSHQVNVEGLNNLLQLSSNNTHVIQISSDYVFDGNNGPYCEHDYTFPINYYGKSKLEAENILRGSRHTWTILRPNVIYGEDLSSKTNFLAWVYKSLIKNNKISVVTDQISNPSYIKDVTKSILQCILMSYEGLLHVGSDNFISRYEFAIEIAKTFDLDQSLIEPITTEKLIRNNINYNAKRPNHSGLNIEIIEKELNLTTCTTLHSLKKIKSHIC
jgi:dTDP-4-dehydrorhamnose reductase